MQHIDDRMRDVEQPASVAADHEEEGVPGGLQHQAVEVAVAHEGGLLLRAERARSQHAAHIPQVLHCHPQHCQLVQPARHGPALGDHGAQLKDVSVHLVSSSLLNFTMVLPVLLNNE